MWSAWPCRQVPRMPLLAELSRAHPVSLESKQFIVLSTSLLESSFWKLTFAEAIYPKSSLPPLAGGCCIQGVARPTLSTAEKLQGPSDGDFWKVRRTLRLSGRPRMLKAHQARRRAAGLFPLMWIRQLNHQLNTLCFVSLNTELWHRQVQRGRRGGCREGRRASLTIFKRLVSTN